MINSSIGMLKWRNTKHWLIVYRLNFFVLCVCRCFDYFSREFCLLNVYFQADRAVVMRREKELNLKVESAEAFRNVNENVDSRIEELELQLQMCLIEKNDLEINMEEAVQDSGKITWVWYRFILIVFFPKLLVLKDVICCRKKGHYIRVSCDVLIFVERDGHDGNSVEGVEGNGSWNTFIAWEIPVFKSFIMYEGLLPFPITLTHISHIVLVPGVILIKHTRTIPIPKE